MRRSRKINAGRERGDEPKRGNGTAGAARTAERQGRQSGKDGRAGGTMGIKKSKDFQKIFALFYSINCNLFVFLEFYGRETYTIYDLLRIGSAETQFTIDRNGKRRSIYR